MSGCRESFLLALAQHTASSYPGEAKQRVGSLLYASEVRGHANPRKSQRLIHPLAYYPNKEAADSMSSCRRAVLNQVTTPVCVLDTCVLLQGVLAALLTMLTYSERIVL
jgi:hypothetical protein